MAAVTRDAGVPDDVQTRLTIGRKTPSPTSSHRLSRTNSAKPAVQNEKSDVPTSASIRRQSTSSIRVCTHCQQPTNTDDPQWPIQSPVEPTSALSRTVSSNSRRPTSFRSPSVRASLEGSLSRSSSLRAVSRRSSLDTLHEIDRSPVLKATDDGGLPGLPHESASGLTRPTMEQQSLLRHMSRPTDEVVESLPLVLGAVTTIASAPGPSSKKTRPKSLPHAPSFISDHNAAQPNPNRASLPVRPDNWPLPSMFFSAPEGGSDSGPLLPERPRPTLKSISSLDHMLNYRSRRDSWKHESSIYQQQSRAPSIREEQHELDEIAPAVEHAEPPPAAGFRQRVSSRRNSTLSMAQNPRFRHVVMEVGFCFTIAMTQLIAEYLISGFAVILPTLFNDSAATAGMTGMFWPAALLSLILSATLLMWARISDMYGGYYPFMLGLLWLTIWTVVPGFFPRGVILDVSRAMQGLSIAAFTPSTFSLVGSIYGDSTRKNYVLGLYGACAPLGFYAGFLAGGALPEGYSQWYFWIAAALSFITLVTAYLTVPADKIDRKKLDLSMDWAGAILITSGLILVAYALAVEPYINVSEPARSGFAFPGVYAPLASGVLCLAGAVWVELRFANCPLLPKAFFRPQGVTWFCIACLFFYAAYGAWLYNSAEFFADPLVTSSEVKPIMLSLWYTPMAIGGVVFCMVGSRLVESVPTRYVLGFSGLAWIGSSVVFAVGPLPLNYWTEVMPSMICSTLGLDLTFTVSIIFLSRVQPVHYQGVAGAVTSVLINLAMSFSLPISSIVKSAAEARVTDDVLDRSPEAVIWGFRAAFMYSTASAAVGLVICMVFVKISRNVMKPQAIPADEERSNRSVRGASSEATTLADV